MNEPCLNRSFLEWFEEQDTGEWRVFEFGAGYSTLWFAERVHQIVSAEHSDLWWKVVRDQLDPPHRVHIFSVSDLSKSIVGEGPFDFILVDGRGRISCAMAAIERLRPGGYLALDDAQRNRYQAGVAGLTRRLGPARYFKSHEHERLLALWRKKGTP